jgi:hypothetical protein
MLFEKGFFTVGTKLIRVPGHTEHGTVPHSR